MASAGDVKKVLVVGAGTMGHGIAQSFAQEGFEVALYSRTAETLERARSLIISSLEAFTMEGMVDRDSIPAIIQRIKMTQSLQEAALDADIAFETVVENREAKIDIFNQLDKYCPEKTLLASNTTALNIFDFVRTSRPDRVLIAHWYTPPQLIPLVDVVRGEGTSEESIDIMVQVLRAIGKEPMILKKFVSGYIVSRLQIATLREIFYLLDNDIVTAEELDLAAKTGLAMRMMVLGLVQRIDFGGLDLTIKNLDNPYVQKQLTPQDYKPKKIYELVQKGHLGVKTGRGFYDYGGKSEAEVCFARDLKLIKMLKAYKELKQMK
ncbi:MAG: 3-hydroxyacyl-CoA dehydrogenase NAD-binding domain-containing protein [Dehalococcoidia bacterium]|nr:3-hydroxyacyl-CoA dehydrogenase NAD-binding domain-containing protein [Dehalococcoidia bacterium]